MAVMERYALRKSTSTTPGAVAYNAALEVRQRAQTAYRNAIAATYKDHGIMASFAAWDRACNALPETVAYEAADRALLDAACLLSQEEMDETLEWHPPHPPR